MSQGGCGCLLITLGAGVVGFWAGCQGLYTAATNWSPTEMTCAEYVEQQPTATWVRLTECDADYIDTVYMEDDYGGMETIYVPLVPSGSDFETPAHIVLETEEESKMALVQGVFDKVGAAGDEMALISAMLEFEQNKAVEIEGMILFGWELDDDTKRQVGGLSETVAPDFVMLREGQSPSIVGSLAWIGLGVAGFFGFFLMLMGLAGDDE